MLKTIKNGTIKFRKPNVAERLIMLGEMGYSQTKLAQLEKSAEDSSESFIFIGKLLIKFGDFVEEIKVNHNGVEITDYNTLLEYEDYTEEITELATSMVGEVDKEKKID